MIRSIIVAMTRNHVIGRDGDMPWRLSADLKRFKALTMGKPVVMGRKCFQSIGRPLPGRPNIVISRDPAYSAEGVFVVASLEQGLDLAAEKAAALGVDEVCVLGGGQIYAQALALVDVLHVTHIEADIDGDTLFPQIDPSVWQSFGEIERVEVDEKNSHPSHYVQYRRILPRK